MGSTPAGRISTNPSLRGIYTPERVGKRVRPKCPKKPLNSRFYPIKQSLFYPDSFSETVPKSASPGRALLSSAQAPAFFRLPFASPLGQQKLAVIAEWATRQTRWPPSQFLSAFLPSQCGFPFRFSILSAPHSPTHICVPTGSGAPGKSNFLAGMAPMRPPRHFRLRSAKPLPAGCRVRRFRRIDINLTG